MTTESVNSIENDNESPPLDREMSRRKSTPLIRKNAEHKSFQSNEIENRFFDRLNVKNDSRKNKEIGTENQGNTKDGIDYKDSIAKNKDGKEYEKEYEKENEVSEEIQGNLDISEKEKGIESKYDKQDDENEQSEDKREYKDKSKENENSKDKDRKKKGGNDKNPLLMTKSRLLVQYDDFEKDKNKDGGENEMNGDEVKDREDDNKSEGTGEEEDEEGKIEIEDADNKKNGNLNRKGKVFLSKYFSINFSCCRLLQWMVILQAYKTVLQIH